MQGQSTVVSCPTAVGRGSAVGWSALNNRPSTMGAFVAAFRKSQLALHFGLEFVLWVHYYCLNWHWMFLVARLVAQIAENWKIFCLYSIKANRLFKEVVAWTTSFNSSWMTGTGVSTNVDTVDVASAGATISRGTWQDFFDFCFSQVQVQWTMLHDSESKVEPVCTYI